MPSGVGPGGAKDWADRSDVRVDRDGASGGVAALMTGRRILEERYNLEDALVVATFLNSFINHAHIVKIANMAQLVNVIAPIFTSDKGMFLQTIYYPLQLFANNPSA